jgi:hypothetical protein
VGNGENTLEAREDSMQSQLAGTSAAVTVEEAAAGLAAADHELAHGRGAGYGVGFGYVKNFGSTRGLDGIRLECMLTDGERVANVHATSAVPDSRCLATTAPSKSPTNASTTWR